MNKISFKSKRFIIPSYVQIKNIIAVFPDAESRLVDKGVSEVIIKVRPKILSPEYRVKIEIYHSGDKVRVYAMDKLRIAENRSKLPHIYSSSKQQLCLYSPSKREWTSDKLIVRTIVPWISDWLFNYELWLIDGEWYGGGHDEYSNESNIELEKNESKKI